MFRDLGPVLGVVFSPSSKRSEWISFSKVVASCTEAVSSAILGQAEIVYDRPSGSWRLEDESCMDVVPLEVLPRRIISEFDTPDEDILDRVPFLDLVNPCL